MDTMTKTLGTILLCGLKTGVHTVEYIHVSTPTWIGRFSFSTDQTIPRHIVE